MMLKRWALCYFWPQLLYLWASWEVTDVSSNNDLHIGSESFQKYVQIVTCSHRISAFFTLLRLDDNNGTMLVSWKEDTEFCNASLSNFVNCEVNKEGNFVKIKAMVFHLQEKVELIYTCKALFVTASTSWSEKNISISRTVVGNATPSVFPTTDCTTFAVVESSHSSSGSGSPSNIVIGVLVVLIVLCIACCALALYYFRGRRRKELTRQISYAEAMSVRSTEKSFRTVNGCQAPDEGITETGSRYNNKYTTAPNVSAPAVPGTSQWNVMQYQKPSDCMSEDRQIYFSDQDNSCKPSVHYQEPYRNDRDDPESFDKLNLIRIPDYGDKRDISSSETIPPSTGANQEFVHDSAI